MEHALYVIKKKPETMVECQKNLKSTLKHMMKNEHLIPSLMICESMDRPLFLPLAVNDSGNQLVGN